MTQQHGGRGQKDPGMSRSDGEETKAGAGNANDLSQTEASASAREGEAYRREKEAEGRRMAAPAEAQRDPDWQNPGPVEQGSPRSAARPGQTDAAPDAQGQAERGAIDQTVTDKGYTSRR